MHHYRKLFEAARMKKIHSPIDAGGPIDQAIDKIDHLPDTPRIVCLCGSTRFKAEFEKAEREFTRQGCIVLTVGSFERENDLGTDVKTNLDELHKRKIDIADEVHVINKEGYIGASTKSEIEYAKGQGVLVTYAGPVEA